MIKQLGVFIEKVEKALNRLGYSYTHGFVNYCQGKTRLTGLTPFDKLGAFDYQKEFRFFVHNELDEPIKIKIGSMKSYAEILKAKDQPELKLESRFHRTSTLFDLEF